MRILFFLFFYGLYVYLFQCFDYSAAGESVAVGVDGFAHCIVVCRTVEQKRYFAYYLVVVGSNEFYCAGFEGFGALGGVAHNQYGLTKAGGLFLNTAAVGEDNVALFHKVNKGEVFQWLDEEHIAKAAEVLPEHFVDGFAYVGVQVHRVDKIYIRILLCQVFDGCAHTDESIAEVFASVTGDEN